MMRDDSRGRRVAIVADCLINPQAVFYRNIVGLPSAVIDVLIEDGWGMMKMPAHVVDESIARSAAETTAGDAVDYLRHGYTVVILAAEGIEQGGVWLSLMEEAFRDLRTPMPSVVSVPRGADVTAIRAGLTAAQKAQTDQNNFNRSLQLS
jgi:hypothetical protein